MPKQVAEMLVENATMVLSDVKLVRLRWPVGYSPEFRTGQFITVYWPDTPSYKRAYSVCSCVEDKGYFEIGVKRDGKMGTRIVDWAKVGDKMLVLPPAGRFLPEFGPGKRMVCLAGGSGVTPFRAFAREAALRQLSTPLAILYSVRTPADVIFNDELHGLAEANRNLHFRVTCTRLTPEDPWKGRRGRINAEWIKEQIVDLPNTVFYACGPTVMVEESERLLIHELGVAKENIRVEKWG